MQMFQIPVPGRVRDAAPPASWPRALPGRADAHDKILSKRYAPSALVLASTARPLQNTVAERESQGIVVEQGS